MSLNRTLVSILALVTSALAACASGTAIVTGNVRSPISPTQVRIYLDPPASFETIGLVSASSDAGLTEQGSLDYAIAELKHQAAKLGANGVLLTTTSDRTTSTVTSLPGGIVYSVPITAKGVQARAIFVPAP